MEKALNDKTKSSVARNNKRKQRTVEKGFSLVEFLVGSAITLATVTLSFSLLDQGQTAIATQRSKATAQARARKVLNLMTSDIRATGSSPGNFTAGVAPGLSSASETSIRLVSDRSGNGTTNQVNEEDANDDVTYTFSTTNKTITRSAPNDPAYNNTPAVLTNEIQSLIIKYYDKTGIELVPPSGSSLDSDNRKLVTRINIIAVINVMEKGQVIGTVSIDNPIAIRHYITDGS